jgi:predicted transcriptional regulator of viral defense system
MNKDLGPEFEAYMSAGLPMLQRTTITKLAGRPVHLVTSLHLGAFKHIKDQHIRVSTPGRTFLDMLHEPTLCGGISHVLSVFKEHASVNKRLILDEIDQHGKGIDKVRAGFIFEEICKITDPRIDAWTAHAQRGGSRKLDAGADYSPTFSERWALSINVPIAT